MECERCKTLQSEYAARTIESAKADEDRSVAASGDVLGFAEASERADVARRALDEAREAFLEHRATCRG